MLNKITPFRYIYAVAVIFTLINALFFIGSGVARSIKGYKGFFRSDFLITEGHHPGLHLLEAFLRQDKEVAPRFENVLKHFRKALMDLGANIKGY